MIAGVFEGNNWDDDRQKDMLGIALVMNWFDAVPSFSALISAMACHKLDSI